MQRRLAAILAADVASYTQLMEEDTDGTVAAWRAAREAVVRQQNDADAHAYLEMFLGMMGKSGDGVKALEQAISLNPQFIGGSYLNQLGQTHILAGEYEKGVEVLEENVQRGGPVGPPAICWGSASLMGVWAKGRRAQVCGAHWYRLSGIRARRLE